MRIRGQTSSLPVASELGSFDPRAGALRRSVGPLMVIVAFALAACGGGISGPGPAGGQTAAGSQAPAGTPSAISTSGSGNTAIDACSLLTSDEVQAKAGDTVSKTEKTDRSCTWWLGKDQTSWIQLTVWRNGRSTFDAMAPEGQPVAGLGEKAFSDGNTLVALKGDTMLQLGSEIVTSNADPAVFNQPLMELALSRL